jgi:hypothetical protein
MKLLARVCHTSCLLASKAYSNATLLAATPAARLLIAGFSPT